MKPKHIAQDVEGRIQHIASNSPIRGTSIGKLTDQTRKQWIPKGTNINLLRHKTRRLTVPPTLYSAVSLIEEWQTGEYIQKWSPPRLLSGAAVVQTGLLLGPCPDLGPSISASPWVNVILKGSL